MVKNKSSEKVSEYKKLIVDKYNVANGNSLRPNSKQIFEKIQQNDSYYYNKPQNTVTK